MTRHIALLFSLLAILLLTACGGSSSQRPSLAVSVEPQRAMLEEIVGDRFDVVTLLGKGANPETFDPTMRSRMEAENARAFFTTGSMPFEERIAEALPATVKVVDVSAGIEPIYGTHGHDHGHDHGHAEETHGHEHSALERDPHLCVSVRNARVIARNMYEQVVALDSASKDYYTDNYRRLDARLDSLDRAFSARLTAAPSRAFAIWHPSLRYLPRDFGLEQAAVGFENKVMSPPRLTETVDHARADSVKVFFFQTDYDSRQAQTLNQQMGTRLVTINPLVYEWEDALSQIVNALTLKP